MIKYIAFLSENPDEDLIIYTFFEYEAGCKITFYIVGYQGGFNLEKLKYIAVDNTLYYLIGNYYKNSVVKFYQVKINEIDEERQSLILEVIGHELDLTLPQIQREFKLNNLLK